MSEAVKVAFCEECRSTYTAKLPCRCSECEDCGGHLELDAEHGGCSCECTCSGEQEYRGSFHVEDDPELTVRDVYSCDCGFHAHRSIYYYGVPSTPEGE